MNGGLPAVVGIDGLGLRLREWTDADLSAMVALFDEPEVARWTPLASPFDLSAAHAYLVSARTRRAEGRGVQLAITVDGGAPLGEILLAVPGPAAAGPGGVAPADVASMGMELAYAVGVAHRGRRLAVRSVRLATGFAYRSLGTREVILRIHPDNAASTAVARAAGFRRTDAPPITRRDSGPLYTWRHHLTGTPV